MDAVTDDVLRAAGLRRKPDREDRLAWEIIKNASRGNPHAAELLRRACISATPDLSTADEMFIAAVQIAQLGDATEKKMLEEVRKIRGGTATRDGSPPAPRSAAAPGSDPLEALDVTRYWRE
jgi:hypothetical protein